MSASTPEVVPTTSLADGGKREREEEDGSAPDEMMMPTCVMRTEEEPQQQPDVDDADNHHGCTAEEEHDDDDASQLLAEAARRVAELEAEEDSAVELFSFKYRLALHEAGIIAKYMAMGEAWCTTHASAEEVEAAPSSSNMCDVSSATAALSVASAELHAAITTAELTNHVLQHTLIIIGGSTPPSMTPCATDLVECLQELRTAAHAEVPPPPSSSSSYATASSSSSSRAELLRFISQTIEVSKQLSGVLSVVAHDPIIHQAMTNMQTELQRISEGLLRLSQQRQRGVEQREKVHEHLRSYIITAGECSLLAAQRRLLDQVGLMSSREVMQEQVEVVQNKLLRRRLHHFGTLLVAKHLAQRTEGMSMMLPLMNASTPTMDGSFRDAEARVASLEGLRDGLMKEMLLLRRRCVLEFGSDPLLNTNNEGDEDHRQLYGGQVVLHRAVLAEVLRGCHDTLASVLAEVGVAGASSTYSSMVARLLKSREAIASRQHSLAAQLAANCSLAHNNNTAALLMQPSATATTTSSSSSSASLPNTNTNSHHLLRMQDSILRDYHQCMEEVVRVAEAMMAQLHLRCHQPHQYMVDEVLQLVQHVGAADTLQLAQIDAAPAFPEALPALVKELMSVDCGGIRAMQQLVSTTHHDDDDDDQPRTYSVLLPALPTSSQEEVLPTFARARDDGAQAEEAQRWADDADAITAMTAQLEWLSRINISDAPERLAAEEAEVEELRARLKVACAATAQSHILHQRHAAAVAALATITNVAKPDLMQRIAAHEEELRRLQQANEALEEARRAKEAEAQAAAEAAETLAKEQAEAAAAAAQVAEDDEAPAIGDALVDDVPMFADEDAVEGPIMEEDAVDAPQHDDDPDAEGPQQDEENEEAELEDGEEDEEEEEQQMSSFHSFPTEDEVTDVVVDAVNDGVLDEEVPPATTMDPTNSSINTSGATFLSFPSDDVNPFASGFGFDEDEE